MSAPLRRWCVMVTSWQAHSLVVEATSAAAAEAEAERLWTEDSERFSFKDGGLDGVFAEAVRP